MKAMNAIKLGLVFTIFISTPVFSFWFTVPCEDKAILSMGQSSESTLNPNEINLLVWNTYKAKNPSWEADYNFLGLNKDIVLLQEALMNSTMKSVFENDYDKHYKLATSFIYTKNNFATGVTSGAKVEPSNYYFKKTKHLEWLGLTPKALLFTEYPIEGRNETLLAINIHALNSVPWWIFASHLKDASKEINNHNGPVIFAGDFNTWSILKERYMRKFMKKHGLEEVIFPNGGDRMKVKLTGKFLDYIFIKGLDYDNSWVWGDLEGADHKAMTVRLRAK